MSVRSLAYAALFLVLAPVLLFAQGDPAEPGFSPLGALVVAVLLPVVGWVAGKIYDGIKTILPFYDNLPAVIHQALAPLWGVAFGWATAAAGVPAILDLAGIDADWLNGLLVAGVMAGIKRWEKSKAPADTTLVLEASRASQPGMRRMP